MLDGGDFDVDVDAVEERAGDFIEVAADFEGGGAAPLRVAEAARAGGFRASSQTCFLCFQNRSPLS